MSKKSKSEEKLRTLPHVIRDRTPRWKVLNVKTLTGTGFLTEAEAKHEMIVHQYMAIWWNEPPTRTAANIGGAVYEFAHLLAKNPEIVKEILACQSSASPDSSSAPSPQASLSSSEPPVKRS